MKNKHLKLNYRLQHDKKIKDLKCHESSYNFSFLKKIKDMITVCNVTLEG